MNKPDAASPDLRQRILDAAVELFAARGYGSTSVRQVVEAVGCTKPALYYHFGSKEDLYLEAVQTRLLDAIAQMRAALDAPGTLVEKLERFADVLLTRVRKHPHAMRLVLTAEHHPDDDGTPRVNLLSLHMELLSLLTTQLASARAAGELRSDLDLTDLAMAYVGMVHVRSMACLYEMDLPADGPAVLTDIFLHGAQPRE